MPESTLNTTVDAVCDAPSASPDPAEEEQRLRRRSRGLAGLPARAAVSRPTRRTAAALSAITRSPSHIPSGGLTVPRFY